MRKVITTALLTSLIALAASACAAEAPEETPRGSVTISTELPENVFRTSGPSTAGSTIEIADKQLKLPDDAWIERRAMENGLCRADLEAQDACLAAPVYEIARDGKTVTIGSNGRILLDDLPLDVETFGFLAPVARN